MDFGMQPDFLALWKQEKTQLALGHSLWPVTGKRKAEDWTAETWKKRRHEKVESFPKDARFSTHDEVALLEVFGARCADLPTLLASVGWAAVSRWRSGRGRKEDSGGGARIGDHPDRPRSKSVEPSSSWGTGPFSSDGDTSGRPLLFGVHHCSNDLLQPPRNACHGLCGEPSAVHFL
ncbi:unnamed protein product [Durusdinium trenchii]|uniref:Uncharacterized protein n=1 Tax=Durusdinium trenchii TaxID=1381693 RepID=A0ABP0KI48_9DINO